MEAGAFSDTNSGGPRSQGIYGRFGKRGLDLLIALPVALITLPVMAVVTLLAAAQSRRWGISGATRVGQFGRPFTLYRITPTGGSKFDQVLKAWSLDELPQLWTVIVGKMSLVGPRPMTPEAVAELADWQQQRHQVRPGLSGVWQVRARGDGRELTDNIHFDIQYIDQMSLVTDIGILLETVGVLATQREGKLDEDHGPAKPSKAPHLRLMLADMLVLATALVVAVVAHSDFSWTAVDESGLAWALLLALATQLLWGFSVGMYQGRWRLGSYEESAWVAASALVTTGALFASTLLPGGSLLPTGAILTAGALYLVGALGVRYVARAVLAANERSAHGRPHKMIVFGVGVAGTKAAAAIWADPEADALPVAFLDDDPVVRRRRPLGLPVVGGRGDVKASARRYDADTLLIAMPSASRSVIAAVADEARLAGLGVRILPRLAKFVTNADEEVLSSDIRDITLADLLGREEIELDLDQIADYLAGKRVLITGAGGSIGSALCEIVEGFEAKKVYKLDRDENALANLQLQTQGRALLESDELVLCDIRDRSRLMEIIANVQPEVVFHAAAHKHVTFLERHPAEAVKTNIVGTLNVLEAARSAGVERFVNVSTDKAAQPESILGLTKRIAEMLTSHFAEEEPDVYMSVRFGNVLGSKGSVIPTFRSQIERGLPITITDADVTRYFMTIDEACQLVVQAGAFDGRGNVLVLDMGEPVKIVELASRLQHELRPGRPPNIVYTGLRPGEKLHEVLAGPEEIAVDQPHALLSRYRVPALDPSRLGGLSTLGDDLVPELHRLIGQGAGVDVHR